MSILIKNGTIVTATDRYVGDVFVEGEKITTIGSSLTMQADRAIDAKGKYVLPGGIDVHTHMDMPFGGTTSADDFESGTIAAAFGGTTTIVGLRDSVQGADAASRMGNVDEKGRRQGRNRLRLPHDHHRPHRPGRDRDGRTGEARRHLVQVVHGLPGRLHAGRREHLSSDATNGQERRHHLHARRKRRRDRRAGEGSACKRSNRAEVSRADASRPAEGEATHRAIALAEIADVPVYIVHLSATEALEMVTEARDRGLPAFAETCPQYLFLSYDNYEEPGFEGSKYVMSPPLRRRRRRTALARARLQRSAGDRHRPLPVLHEGEAPRRRRLLEDPERRARHRDAHEPRLRRRRAHGQDLAEPLRRADVDVAREDLRLFPKKGTIAPGSDADIVIFDPDKKTTLSAKTHHMKVDYNPYEGRQVTGAADTVLSRGKVIIEGGKFTGKAGAGSFLKRDPRQI
jgi:dihydropyrimidinase